MTRSSLDVVAPAFRWVPESYTTLGDEVADLATRIGFGPDPEQRLGLDMMYAANQDRTWASFVFAVICSRQNLKTGLFKMAAIADLFLFEDELVVWTAHLFATAEGAFWDIKKLIDANDMLSRRVKKITTGSGDMEIELHSGAKMKFLARSLSGGRGMTGSKVFLDEGFALQRSHIGSLFPTLATVPGAQVRIGSSAGLVDSAVLRGFRDRGRAGGDDSLAYLEWCDTEPAACQQRNCDHLYGVAGCSLDDRDRWRRSNPAMGRRIAEKRIANFRKSMPADEFAREFLGWWDEPRGEPVIPDALWLAGLDVSSRIAAGHRFALDVSPAREYASIGVSGVRADSRAHVEVTSRRGEIDHRPGTDWVLERLGQLHTAFPEVPLAIAAGSAAATLIPAIEQLGMAVELVPNSEVPAACGLFYDLATAPIPGVVHLGQPALNDAVTDAQRLFVGDRAFTWARRQGDITCLYVATLALWAAHKAQQADYAVSDSIY